MRLRILFSLACAALLGACAQQHQEQFVAAPAAPVAYRAPVAGQVPICEPIDHFAPGADLGDTARWAPILEAHGYVPTNLGAKTRWDCNRFRAVAAPPVVIHPAPPPVVIQQPPVIQPAPRVAVAPPKAKTPRFKRHEDRPRAVAPASNNCRAKVLELNVPPSMDLTLHCKPKGDQANVTKADPPAAAPAAPASTSVDPPAAAPATPAAPGPTAPKRSSYTI